MQKLIPIKVALTSLLIFGALLCSCEYEKIPGPHVVTSTTYLKSFYNSAPAITINSPVWKNTDYFIVPLNNLSIHKTDLNDGVLNGTGTFNGLQAFIDTAKLILRSIYTNDRIYILAEWQDTTLDAVGRSWLWNGPKDNNKTDDSANWTIQNNDDKLIMKFEFPTPSLLSEDIWVWSVAQSDPLGYAIDMSSKADQTTVLDAGTPMFARNGTNNRSGPQFEFNGQVQTVTKSSGSNGLLDAGYFLFNKTENTGNPAEGIKSYNITCINCHGQGTNVGYAPQLNKPWLNAMSRTAIKTFILDPDLHSDGYADVDALSEVALNDVFAYLRGQAGTPGYYLQNPSGSVADVITTSSVQTGKINISNTKGYKVLFSRKLNTGNPDDITFDTKDGNKYTFGIQICNRDSVNYIGAIKQTIEFKKTQDEN